MVNNTRCCVPYCSDTKSAKRVLPIFDEKVYNIWIERIGNPKLKTIEPTIAHKRYRVCDRHFSEYCRVPGHKKLKIGSLPTLHLPGFFEMPTPENSIFKHQLLAVRSAKRGNVQVKLASELPGTLDNIGGEIKVSETQLESFGSLPMDSPPDLTTLGTLYNIGPEIKVSEMQLEGFGNVQADSSPDHTMLGTLYNIGAGIKVSENEFEGFGNFQVDPTVDHIMLNTLYNIEAEVKVSEPQLKDFENVQVDSTLDDMMLGTLCNFGGKIKVAETQLEGFDLMQGHSLDMETWKTDGTLAIAQSNVSDPSKALTPKDVQLVTVETPKSVFYISVEM